MWPRAIPPHPISPYLRVSAIQARLRRRQPRLCLVARFAPAVKRRRRSAGGGLGGFAGVAETAAKG